MKQNKKRFFMILALIGLGLQPFGMIAGGCCSKAGAPTDMAPVPAKRSAPAPARRSVAPAPVAPAAPVVAPAAAPAGWDEDAQVVVPVRPEPQRNSALNKTAYRLKQGAKNSPPTIKARSLTPQQMRAAYGEPINSEEISINTAQNIRRVLEVYSMPDGSNKVIIATYPLVQQSPAKPKPTRGSVSRADTPSSNSARGASVSRSDVELDTVTFNTPGGVGITAPAGTTITYSSSKETITVNAAGRSLNKLDWALALSAVENAATLQTAAALATRTQRHTALGLMRGKEDPALPPVQGTGFGSTAPAGYAPDEAGLMPIFRPTIALSPASRGKMAPRSASADVFEFTGSAPARTRRLEASEPVPTGPALRPVAPPLLLDGIPPLSEAGDSQDATPA